MCKSIQNSFYLLFREIRISKYILNSNNFQFITGGKENQSRETNSLRYLYSTTFVYSTCF